MRRIGNVLGGALLCAAAQNPTNQKAFTPVIPKVWDDAEMAKIELPRAATVDVRQLPSSYYYTIPERTIWTIHLTLVVFF